MNATKIRNSITHPLVISDYAVSNGYLGISFCPGKKQTTGMTGAWDRDLTTDIQAIKDWGASLAICCIPRHELRMLHVPDIDVEFARANIDFLALPFEDDTPPNVFVEEILANRMPNILTRLESGEKIFVFCKGGLGRSGSIFASILIASGIENDMAISITRAIRPGAIYTPEQYDWVTNS